MGKIIEILLYFKEMRPNENEMQSSRIGAYTFRLVFLSEMTVRAPLEFKSLSNCTLPYS